MSQEITIKPIRLVLEMTPELKALCERVNNPKDLNDAILAVKGEAYAKELSDRIIEAALAMDILKPKSK